MCENCFLKGISGFATWQVYESVSKVIQAKRAAGQLVVTANPTLNSLVNNFMAVDAYYQCSSCQEIWGLSSPDNAWRGYFLPIKRAVIYMQRVKNLDRAKGIAGLMLVAVVLILTLWKMLK